MLFTSVTENNLVTIDPRPAPPIITNGLSYRLPAGKVIGLLNIGAIRFCVVCVSHHIIDRALFDRYVSLSDYKSIPAICPLHPHV